jgi:hypothetical protein
MWKRWNGDKMKDDPSMNSYNHYAHGAVADWMDRYAAGTDATLLDAGFHTVVLHPVFDARLGSTAFDYDSSYGPIHSDWRVQEDGDLAYGDTANTTGWLAADASKYKMSGVALNQNQQLKAATRDGAAGIRSSGWATRSRWNSIETRRPVSSGCLERRSGLCGDRHGLYRVRTGRCRRIRR